MNITKFNEKLNKLEGNTYTIEEVVTLVNGVYEADLRHDNVEPNTINIYSGSKLTGDKINSYTISTPSLTPWRTHIKIYSSTSPLYITYETIGDTVEADDINNVQNAINDTQNALNNEITRAKNAEKQLQTNIDNEVKRGKDAEKQLQTNIDTEVTRATNAENTLTANLNNEVTRAKKAENTLTTNLSNEVTRAKNAENGIQNIINTNKPKWDDKYTKAEIDNKIDAILTDTVWKESVATFDNLATTYPNPQVGWTVYVEDTGYTYRYDKGSWVKINSYNLPLATSARDGKMSKEDKSFLDSVKSVWANITTHITDTVKHITSAERTLWNTVSNKADKSHTHAKSQITDMPTKLSQFTNDKGFITSEDINTSQNHIHSNKTVLDKITQNSLDNWNDKLQTKKITTATDFDTLKETCVYYIKVSDCPNNPSSNWGTLFVSDEGTLYQIFIPDKNGNIYKRSWNITSSSWDNWVDLRATDGDGKQINTTYVKKGMTWNELEGK